VLVAVVAASVVVVADAAVVAAVAVADAAAVVAAAVAVVQAAAVPVPVLVPTNLPHLQFQATARVRSGFLFFSRGAE